MDDESAAARNLVNTESLIAKLRAIPEFQPLKSKQRRFIFAYVGTGAITKAAKACCILWTSHYDWLHKDANYAKAFDKAREMFADFAEGEVFDRAFFGVEHTKTRYLKNETVVEKHTQKSDILAMFALKGLRPQYRDNWQINNFAGPSHLNIGYTGNAPAIDVTPPKDNESK
jgi:hypothetical protein